MGPPGRAPPGAATTVSRISSDAPGHMRFDALQMFDRVYEPSGAAQMADGRIIIVEDEKEQPFDILAFNPDGSFSERSFTSKGEPQIDAAGGAFEKLDDLEGVTVDHRGYVYAITSHSRTSRGKEKAAREKLIRFRVDGDRLHDPVVVTGLKTRICARFPFLREAAEVLDVKGGRGFNIEGFTFDGEKSRLLIGFRTPLHGGKAVIVAIDNVDGVFDRGEAPAIAAEAIFLDLGGEGIRAMTYDPKLRGYLIVSRRERIAPKDADVAGERPFRLWLWNGMPEEKPRRAAISGLTGLGRAEGIAPLRRNGEARLLIVSDDGNRKKKRPARYLLVGYERLVIAED